ncbi:MAG TPA: hypothetical protein VMA72_15510 [Streptosporangiaceae bacterium]|nr:hypothetical protein [Streptosporangiaceae bacterium]
MAITLTVTGPHLAGLFDSNGLATCQSACGIDAGKFINQIAGSGIEHSDPRACGVLAAEQCVYSVPCQPRNPDGSHVPAR